MRKWFAALAMVTAWAGTAEAQAVTEPAVKAAFLYKFLGYVEWPANATQSRDGALVVGTMGADDVAVELDRIVAGRTVNGRRVNVRRMHEGDSLRGVNLLFVGRGQANPADVLRAAHDQPVLTVTEVDGGLELGSIVNLVTLEDRVGFEISQPAAARAGLSISSRMLGVARRVIPKAGAS